MFFFISKIDKENYIFQYIGCFDRGIYMICTIQTIKMFELGQQSAVSNVFMLSHFVLDLHLYVLLVYVCYNIISHCINTNVDD